MLLLLSALENAMKTTPQEVNYWGARPGFGTLCNAKVENGYTAIVVKPEKTLNSDR
jgi:hypothetical protein